MKQRRERPQNPGEWRDPEVLEELYADRGWTVQDIVDHFDDLGSEDVSFGRVRRQLQVNEIRCGRNNRPPVQGTHAALWEMDKDAVGGDA